MEQQPWAVFSDVVKEVTRAPVDEVRTFMTRRTDESDALLVEELKGVRQDLAELRRRLTGGGHAAGAGSTLPWLLAAAFAGGDLYFIAALLTG